MRNRLVFAIALAAIAAPLFAQAPAAPDRAAAIRDALAQNQAALRQYSWIETTEISLKGDVKKTEQKQCYYGADGKVQKTLLPGAAAAAPPPESSGGRRGGRLKKKVVERKVEELTDYMERVAALVHDYVPPDAEKIRAGQAAGRVAIDPAGTTVSLRVADYLKPGDAVTIGFDSTAKRLSSYSVSSYVEKPTDDTVKLAVTFAALQDGTSYPQLVMLDAPAKDIRVKVTRSGYKKAAP